MFKHIIQGISTLALIFGNNMTSMAAPTISATDNEKEKIAQVIRSYQYVDTHQAEIWPGFGPPDISSILLYPAGETEHVYAFDFLPSQPSLWQKTDIAGKTIYYMPKNSWNLEESYGNTDTVDGQLALLWGPHLLENFDSFSLSKIHSDRFFYYLNQHFNLPSPPPARNDLNDPDSMSLLLLEAYVMSDMDNNNLNTESLKNMLAIEQYRSRFMTPDAKKFEFYMGVRWGIPLYVGSKASGPEDAESGLESRGNTNTEGNDDEDDYGYVRKMEDVKVSASLLPIFRSAVLGMGLDFVKEDAQWKIALEKEGKDPLPKLLEHFPMSDSEIQQRVASAKSKHHFEKNEAGIRAIIQKNEETADRISQQYTAAPGVEIQLTVDWENSEPASQLSPDSDEYREEAILDTNTTLYGDISGYTWEGPQNTDLRISTASAVAMRISQNTLVEDQKQHYQQIFKLSENTRLVYDGHTTTVGEFVRTGKETGFHQIALSGSEVNVSGNLSGTLHTVDGHIELAFTIADSGDKAHNTLHTLPAHARNVRHFSTSSTPSPVAGHAPVRSGFHLFPVFAGSPR